MVHEPVRGYIPDQAFYSLSGIDQCRTYMRRIVPPAPLSRLTGFRLTDVSSGAAALSLPLSPWLELGDGTIDVAMLAEIALDTAIVTMVPPGHLAFTCSVSLQHLRPCTSKSEALVARARVVNAGPRFTAAEVLIEDALGRAVTHATGSAIIRPMDPLPPPLAGEVEPVTDAIYPTPHPHLRPLPPGALLSQDAIDQMAGWQEIVPMWASEKLSHPPACQLFGIQCVGAQQGTTSWRLKTDPWLCIRPYVQPGVLMTLAIYALKTAVATLCPAERRVGVIQDTLHFLGPVAPDGRDVIARAKVVDQRELAVAVVELTDDEGNRVARGSESALITDRRQTRAVERERVLATVLFTDIVRSSERAEKLGDARWGQLLAEHHELVRHQLQIFKGREVKTTGDGFLATFDSPARAIECARAIRDAVDRLGLEIRVGVHLGECDITGTDVAGIAVHIAARIQGLAAPGEILVSSTVRDVVTGSGLRFLDRGRYELKGIEGDWLVCAVEG